jgi:hypothetical protein
MLHALPAPHHSGSGALHQIALTGEISPGIGGDLEVASGVTLVMLYLSLYSPRRSHRYYSRCFSFCGRTTTQRVSRLGPGGYMLLPPFFRGRQAARAARRVLATVISSAATSLAAVLLTQTTEPASKLDILIRRLM